MSHVDRKKFVISGTVSTTPRPSADLPGTSALMQQALLVAFIGFSLGIGLSALFFEVTSGVTALRGFILRPEVVAATAAAVAVILTIASFASLRKVLVLDPAVVFRG